MNEWIVKLDEPDCSGNQRIIEKQELVRCKDCIWWDKKRESNYGYCHACKHGYSSPHWEIGIYRTYEGSWFCADGEKKVD